MFTSVRQTNNPLTQHVTAGGLPRFALRTNEKGVFQHTLSCLDQDPIAQRETGEKFALVLVNYKLPRPLLEPLWRNASVRICADGAINRLYRTFDDDETRSKFIPEYLRGYDSDPTRRHTCMHAYIHTYI